MSTFYSIAGRGTPFGNNNPLGNNDIKHSKPLRPYLPKQPEQSTKKSNFYIDERKYNLLTNISEDKSFIVVVDGFGLPKGTTGKVKDINFPYATIITDNLDIVKETKIRTIGLMWLNDYLEIQDKVDKGLISLVYNNSEGFLLINEKKSIN